MRIIIILTIILAVLFAQENLLSNPDFEFGSDDWMPTTHPDSIPSGCVQEWCATCGVGGTGGLHVGVPGGISGFLGFLALADTAIPGEIYCFAADIKYTAAIRPTLTAVFINELYETISLANEFPLLGNSDWRRIIGYGVAPESTAYIAFVFGSSGECEAWVDNCFLGIGDTAQRSIVVSYSDSIGIIRNLSGTNRGPVNPDNPFDFTSDFANLCIPIVRTHDWYGPGDRHIIFPDWSADPDDSSNYDFTATDSFVTGIINAGAEVFFRLGESWEDDPVYNVPPPDNAVWAKVCKNIVRHYNDGWANGFHYNIRYWEIWNEPDIENFWDGTYEQYYDMYISVAETLKAYNPWLMVGGPAMASPTNNHFLNGMLSTIQSADAPLDFFSWHTYDDGSAFDFVLLNRRLRNRLDAYGFFDTELILNEWNLAAAIRLELEACNSPYNAAIAAGVLMLMQDEDISQIMRYRTDSAIFGLWDHFGELTYSGYAYRLLSELYARPIKLGVENEESTCCAILAGKAHDGSSMAILLSDWSSNRSGYKITITDIPDTSNYRWWVYALDETLNCEPIDSGTAAEETLIISQPMKSPAINLIAIDEIGTTNVNEQTKPEEVKIDIYPNPFNSSCRIRILSSELSVSASQLSQDLKIYNISGKVVDELEITQGTEDVIWHPKGLCSGIYFVRIGDKDSKICKRLCYIR